MNKNWLYTDPRDLNIDFSLCLDDYLQEEKEEYHRKLAEERFRNWKPIQENKTSLNKSSDSQDEIRIIDEIRANLLLRLERKDWSIEK